MECVDCPERYDAIGEPMPGRFFGGRDPDLIVVGHAPNLSESIVFNSMELHGALSDRHLCAYITCLYKCRLAYKEHSNRLPGAYCTKALLTELGAFNTRVIGVIGTHPSQALTGRTAYQVSGAVSSTWLKEYTVVCLPNPLNPEIKSVRRWLRHWDIIAMIISEAKCPTS